MKLIREVINYLAGHKVLLVVILFGSIVNASIFFPITGNMGHDVFWHLALINAAFNKFPFVMPNFAGGHLQGYNYLLDFFMFLLTKTGLSAIYVYFIVIPLLYVLLFGALLVYYGIKKNKSVYYLLSLAFFMYFASPFSYLLSIFRENNLFNGYRYSTAMQSTSSLTNLPYAFTLPVILLTLILIGSRLKPAVRNLIISLLIIAAFGLKFYGGVVVVFFLFIHDFFIFLEKRKIKEFLLNQSVYGAATILSLALFYDPFNSAKTGGIFVLSPLAVIHPLIEDPSMFYLPKLVSARYSLLQINPWSPRLFLIEAFTLVGYIIFNAGTRLIGFTEILRKAVAGKINAIEGAMMTTMVFSAGLTFIFVQKGEWWNIVQFFGYTLFFLNFFAAETLYRLLNGKKIIFSIIIAVVVLMTLPLNIEFVIRAVKRIGTANEIVNDERQALFFLKNKPDGAVFALPVLASSSYVPAFTGKQVFIADEHLLGNLGLDYQSRKNQVKNLKTLDINSLPVRYFYLLKNDNDYLVMLNKIGTNRFIKKVFENTLVTVYEKTFID